MKWEGLIGYFRGPNTFLSNMYECNVTWEGHRHKSVENAYQAAKTDDPTKKLAIQLSTPAGAKKIGQTLRLADGWHKKKRFLMYQLVKQKFTENVELRKKLLDTGNAELVEGNTWSDFYWGVCNGKGSNWLGKILMLVRHQARQESPNSD